MKIFFQFQLKYKVGLVLFYLLLGCSAKKTPESFIVKSNSISISGELKKLIDISSLPVYESGTKSFQVSSYDTTGGNDDGFNGKYSFLSRNSDSTLVVFDAKGPGVINRFWTPTPTEDTLDFYIDSDDQITFSIQYLDLFSGKVYPFVDPLCGNQIGGYFCYFPIPFKQSCKIVSRGKKMQFHQIQYKLFPETTEVSSFSPELSEDERDELERLKMSWNNPLKEISNFYKSADLLHESKSVLLMPGESATIFNVNRGGRIVGIELSPSTLFEGIEKLVDIKITWDDEEHAAINLPVHDFFGFAFGNPSMQSLLVGSQGNKNYCYFPMPFDRSAEIELVYRENGENNPPLNVDYSIYYSEQARNMEMEGKFYAEWNRDINPKKGEPHYFLDRQGKGHYVGTILQAQGLKAGMTLFFEGDDITLVDGEQIIHGTGSEDYFNGGWYAFIDTWDTKVSLPIHGSLDYSLPMCRTGGYRLLLTDKIPFTQHITQSIEHGPVGNAFPVDYTSVAFYYSDTPVNRSTIPTNELSKVFLPDTLIIFPQLMSYDVWDQIAFESGWMHNTGGLSYIYSVKDESRLRISLEDIPYDTYQLFLDVTNFEKGCVFSIWQRQTQLSDWIDTYAGNETRNENRFVCDLDIRDFKNTLTFRFKTQQKRDKLFLDRMILIKKGS